MKDDFFHNPDIAAAVIDTVASLVCILDVDGRILHFNKACENTTGFNRREVIGRKIWDTLIPNDEAARTRPAFDDLINGAQSTQCENHWLTKEGGSRLISWSNIAAPDKNGVVRFIVGTGLDVTEQRRTAQEASERGAQLSSVLNASPDAVLTVDQKGVIQSFSPGAEKLFGYSQEEAVGRNIDLIIAEDQQAAFQDLVSDVNLTDQPWSSGKEANLQGRRKNGPVFPIEVSVAEVVIGGERYFTGVIHDVTARNRLEKISAGDQKTLERLASGAPLSDVLETLAKSSEEVLPGSKCLIMTVDPQTRDLRFRAGPSLTARFRKLADRLEISAEGPPCARACRARRLVSVEDLLEEPGFEDDERNIILEAGVRACCSTPIFSKSGEVIGAFTVFSETRGTPPLWRQDYSRDQAKLAAIAIETNLAQERIQATSKLESIGRLTGGMAHDFNNLLTVIQGNLEMLEARIDAPELKVMLEQAQEATALGGQLTAQLLAFARRQPLKTEPIDVNETIIEMMHILKRALDGGVRVTTTLGENLRPILSDAGQFQSMLLNLALNAREAMPSGGSLVIETANARFDNLAHPPEAGMQAGSYVRISVADNGIGMTPEVRARIFEPFFSTKQNGSGLGLSTVYGFVKQSGGHMFVFSEENRGAKFDIYFPADADAVVERRNPQTETSVPFGAGETVFVVDDNAHVRRVTTAQLRDLRYNVLEAEDGENALRMIGEGAGFDLLLSDLVLSGGVNGRDLGLAVRENRPGVPVVLTSGYADPAVIPNGFKAAGDQFLSKPFSRRQLAETVSAALDLANGQ